MRRAPAAGHHHLLRHRGPQAARSAARWGRSALRLLVHGRDQEHQWRAHLSGELHLRSAGQNYSPAGLLENKRYHDNTGPSYTYSWAGRLAARQWARGITTIYTPNNAGEAVGIAYSDGTTPGATFTYDRRGLPATIADASGTRTLSYTTEGQLDDESYTAGMFAGLTVERGYDTLRRRDALGLPALGAGLATGYGSRLQTVTTTRSVPPTPVREPGAKLET